jgi:glycosyltransferase involved in cell wall biosynthesis
MKEKIIYISDLKQNEALFNSQIKKQIKELEMYFDVKVIGIDNEYSSILDLKIEHYKGDFIWPIVKFKLKFDKNLNEILDNFSPKLIYSRGLRGGLIGLYMKKYHLKNIKLLVDHRADILAEPQNKNILKNTILKNSLKALFKETDVIFTVSDYLALKYLKMFDNNNCNFYTFPTFVPDKKFIFSNEIREKKRIDLRLKDSDILLLYSGNYAKWQNVDFIIEIFTKASEINKNLKLMILTSDISLKFKAASFENENIFVKQSSYEQIDSYYFASDYGLLIRDDDEINRCAYPTKFSEYVNSGLCLIITKVKSNFYKDFIDQRLSGICLESKFDLLKTLISLKKNKKYFTKINTMSKLVHNQYKTISHEIK